MIALSPDDVTRLAWAVGGSPGRYADGMLYPTQEAEAVLADPSWRDGAASPVPAEISKLKLVQELRDRGLWGPFKAALAQDTINQEDWGLANVIERNHPRTAEMGAAFGLDAAGVDDLFRKAAER